jgi:cell surface protein SprA
LKLDYTGTDDEIIKRIKRVIFLLLQKTLIPGPNLYLVSKPNYSSENFVTGVLANQRSQRQSLGLQGGSTSSIFEFKATIMMRTGTS